MLPTKLSTFETVPAPSTISVPWPSTSPTLSSRALAQVEPRPDIRTVPLPFWRRPMTPSTLLT
ncbi:hypothetical protein WJ969_18140 [Achromobacter xylosoxidans]